MIFRETKLQGAYLIELEPHTDDRGFFARTFCAKEFEAQGLKSAIAQCNLSYNQEKGTLRGMHYQKPPFGETKVVSCIKGAINDVIIDLRLGSPTYLQHLAVELTAENRQALYIPEMFAHGFQTLANHTEVLYLMGDFYAPEHAAGIRYDDPTFAINWSLPITQISDKDLNLFWFNTQQLIP